MDEPATETNQGDTAPKPSDPSMQPTGKQEGKKLASGHNPTANRNTEPAPKSMWARWQNHPLPERIMAYFTGVVAICAVIQIFILIGGSGQTDKLIRAANIQACAAKQIVAASQRNATAAENFSKSAASINGGIGNAVQELQTQAGKMDKARSSSELAAKRALDASITASQLDQRPGIVGDGFILSGEPEDGRLSTVKIGVKNTGKTPALSMIPYSQPSIANQCAPLDESNLPAPKGIGILAPGQTGMSFTTDALPYIGGPAHSGPADVYIKGSDIYCVRVKIIYSDASQNTHWTRLCIYHIHGEGLNQFHYCRDGNDVDKNQ